MIGKLKKDQENADTDLERKTIQIVGVASEQVRLYVKRVPGEKKGLTKKCRTYNQARIWPPIDNSISEHRLQ